MTHSSRGPDDGAKRDLKVGFAKIDITPSNGLPMDGYASRKGYGYGSLDPLMARVCYLESSSTAIVVVALDLLGVGAEFVNELRTRLANSLGTVTVLAAATHTHSGPAGIAGPGNQTEESRAYKQMVLEAVETGALQARQVATTADTYSVHVPTGQICANRNDPYPDTDTDLRAIVFRCAETARIMGVLASFACHATVLSADNGMFSADLHGNAAEIAERQLQVPCVLLNGAEGDLSTRFTRRSQDVRELGRLARTLGDVLANSVKQARETAPETCSDRRPDRRDRIATASVTVKLPLREAMPLKDATALLSQMQEELRSSTERRDPPAALRRQLTRIEGAKICLARSQRSKAIAVSESCVLVGVRIDGAVLVAIPGELFSAAAKWLEARCPPAPLLIGLANGYLGYFPSPEAYANQTYEALASPFTEDAYHLLLTAVCNLVARLRRSPLTAPILDGGDFV